MNERRTAKAPGYYSHSSGHGSPAARCTDSAMVVSADKYPPGRVVWDARAPGIVDSLWDPSPVALKVVAVETCEHYPHAGHATVAFQMMEWSNLGRRVEGVRVWLIGEQEARIVVDLLSDHRYRIDGAHEAMSRIVNICKRRRSYSALSESEAFFLKNVLPSVEACLPSWKAR